MDAEGFLKLAAPIMNRAPGQTQSPATITRFKRLFGISPEVCAVVWHDLIDNNIIDLSRKPLHFLWASLFLRQYFTVLVMSIFLCADEVTVRKYMWPMVDALEKLASITVSLRHHRRRRRRLFSNATYTFPSPLLKDYFR